MDQLDELVAVCLGHTLKCEVVAFGGAGCEDDLLGISPYQLCYAETGAFHCLFTGPPKGMIPAGCITKFFGEVRQHLLQNTRINWRGGMIVHVDGKTDPIYLLPLSGFGQFPTCIHKVRSHLVAAGHQRNLLRSAYATILARFSDPFQITRTKPQPSTLPIQKRRWDKPGLWIHTRGDVRDLTSLFAGLEYPTNLGQKPGL